MSDGRWAMSDERWAMGVGAGRWIAHLFDAGLQVSQMRRFIEEIAYSGVARDRRKIKQMNGMKSYKELDVWKLAMTLVESTYRVSRRLPDTERYGLIAQMQRCSVSIPSNIAEGQARGTVRFGLHFLRIAIGSTAELATQLELARRLVYLTAEQTHEVEAELERVQQMLYGMRREHLRRLGIAGATAMSLLLSLTIYCL
jgi:four helix bundle protein